MRTLAAFVRLSRPAFLLGGFTAFALGASIAAYEGVRIIPQLYAAGQAVITAFHLMTHFANDYFDRRSDRGGPSTPFSGGSGVLVAGALAPRTALLAALVCASAGVLGSVAFARAGMIAFAGITTAVGVLAWFYSAPPVRLAARGWGELNTALVVAVLVPLAGYAAFTNRVDDLALAATVAPAFAMFAMMIAVEWPDREADAAGNKRNLIVRFGPAAAARLAACGAMLIVPAMLLSVGRGAPWGSAIFGVALLPAIVGFVHGIAGSSAPAAEIAARGVSVFLLTIMYALLGFVTVLR